MFPTTPLAMDSNDFNNAMLADLNKRRAAEEVVGYKNGVDHIEKKGQVSPHSCLIEVLIQLISYHCCYRLHLVQVQLRRRPRSPDLHLLLQRKDFKVTKATRRYVDSPT